MRGFMKTIISNIVPESMKEDFLEHYTCTPPPIFMVLISIIEVNIGFLQFDTVCIAKDLIENLSILVHQQHWDFLIQLVTLQCKVIDQQIKLI